MRLDHYAHPEFGWLSPTPRLRRDFRRAFLSLLVGIGMGAAAMIELKGYTNAPDQRGSITADHNAVQPARFESDTPSIQGSSQTSADPNSQGQKAKRTLRCQDNNLACPDAPSAVRGMRMPSANNATPSSRATLDDLDTPAGTVAAAPLHSSEKVAEDKSTVRTEWRNPDDGVKESDSVDISSLPHRTSRNTARNRNAFQQLTTSQDRAIYRVGHGYDRPKGEVGRAFAHDRTYGQKGFWAWSR
jgi:hypothetical protein